MNSMELEEIIMDNLLFIGNEIPSSLANDKRDKFILLGNPAQLIKQIKALISN